MATNQRFKERFIGKGAMGNVYELEGHKPPAVIKYMFCGNGEQLRIFKNECEALKAIYHANVVRMLYTEENGRELGIVMEYCQRGSIRDVIFNPTIRYSMNTVLTWAVQLFKAIDHMYQEHKLVHRDIKPDNIFVTNDYQLKVGDFGLVKVVGDRTVSGTFAGTQRYMSPPDMKEDGVQRDVYDQIRDPKIRDSHRNDVYSLGLVVWEIIERRIIFLKYGPEGAFDRDELVFDIAMKRVTEIDSPECPTEIQEIISRCTNFQRIHRPPASEVLNFLKQTQETNEFISSLPFMPTEDKNQKELMKPIGFDDRTEGVMVESEERKYEKRFEVGRNLIIPGIMQDKLGTLNSAKRKKFYKEAPNIVSRLKEETQTFKDARCVIDKILEIEERKENLHEKDIYEILELFVLKDFQEQLWTETETFEKLRSHEEFWISSFRNWWWCEERIRRLQKIKIEKYTTNFYFRCFISQLTGEGWIHIGWNEFAMRKRPEGSEGFVSEDLRLWKAIPGKWVDNPRSEVRSYEIENEDKKHELLHFSHYKQIPFERITETFKKQQNRMETIIKFNLKHLIPVEDSKKNDVPFNIESLLGEFSQHSEYERFHRPHPFPHYLFQLRNPPRPICQKHHSEKCQMDGFRKVGRSDLPKELHIPVCDKITKAEILVLEEYLDYLIFHRSATFLFMLGPFLFLCCQNVLDIPFLILLDHPNNYENKERIPGLDLKEKLHYIDVEVLREYFQKSKDNERVYALIKDYTKTCIRLIDYQGTPKTEWLELEEVPNSASYNQFTDQQEKLELVAEDKEVTKRERPRKNPCCSIS